MFCAVFFWPTYAIGLSYRKYPICFALRFWPIYAMFLSYSLYYIGNILYVLHCLFWPIYAIFLFCILYRKYPLCFALLILANLCNIFVLYIII